MISDNVIASLFSTLLVIFLRFQQVPHRNKATPPRWPCTFIVPFLAEPCAVIFLFSRTFMPPCPVIFHKFRWYGECMGMWWRYLMIDDVWTVLSFSIDSVWGSGKTLTCHFSSFLGLTHCWWWGRARYLFVSICGLWCSQCFWVVAGHVNNSVHTDLWDTYSF